MSLTAQKTLVKWFDEVGLNDLGIVGGKNSSLGEMLRNLKSVGVSVPNGFATTSEAYNYYLEFNSLEAKIREVFANLDPNSVESLRSCGHAARSLILNGHFPNDLELAIVTAYHRLCDFYKTQDVDVAVRSSATAEDLPDASFAGQQESFLNVSGIANVLHRIKMCFASVFTDRAISYRERAGFNHFDIALSCGVQKMVRSDLACSGVMFSIDTETGFKNSALITASYGLGEMVVQGAVNPDEFIVFKPTLEQGYPSIIRKNLGSKIHEMIYGNDGGTKVVDVLPAKQQRFALTDQEVLQLAEWAVAIENYYTQVRGVYTPMDIEWAKDGETGALFIVQARPETVESQVDHNVLKTFRLTSQPTQVLLQGVAVGSGIVSGQVHISMDPENPPSNFADGDILVAPITTPSMLAGIKPSGIVTNQGGRTCHAAIVAREMGIPAVVGTGNATQTLRQGQFYTINNSEGVGLVHEGQLDYTVDEERIDNLPPSPVKLLMNVGDPNQAFAHAQIPNDGVGLARTELIIMNQVGVHPKALINFDALHDDAAKWQISQRTVGYTDKSQYFVDKLAQGTAMIAAAFYPNPVILRMSDLKSNEYRDLIGGKEFEPAEENPMLGWRGASRYVHPNYQAAFALECQAMKRVRDVFGLTNVILMIPFCRTPEEGRQVIQEMAKNGLVQGENGLQIYVMCELPSNVVLAEEFAEIFDGFSIGSNDLTQLTLGLDRDSALVSHLFDERNPAVLRMLEKVIKTVKAKEKKIGICGQGPSDFPELAVKLVEWGIDSISLNPDSVLKTRIALANSLQG